MFFIFFILGLIIGSFLNVVIVRLETNESILFSRSHCPHCHTPLKWFELIPLLSFVFQKGRCRYCQKKISWQYPLVELATGFLFLVIYSLGFQIWELGFYLLIACFLLIVFVYDFKYYLIPDEVIYPAIGLSIIFNFLVFLRILPAGQNSDFILNWWNPFLSGFLVSGFFLFLILITKGKGMGLGDVKLGFLMGLLLGWPRIIIALVLSFASGALVGLLLVFLKRKTLKSKIPFGPFLTASTLLTLLFGHYLVKMIEGIIIFNFII